MIACITFLVFMLIIMFHFKSNYAHPRWAITFFIGAGIFSYMISQQSNMMLGLVYFWLLFNALFWGSYNLTFRANPYADLENSRTAIAVFISGVFFLFLDRITIDAVMSFIPLIIIFNVFFKLLPYATRKVSFKERKFDQATKQIVETTKTVPLYGIGGNSSVDATFISLLVATMLPNDYPFYLKEIGLICAAWCLWNNKATAGALGFFAAILTYLALTGNLLAAGLIAWILAVLAVWKRAEIFQPSGRIEIWEHAIKNLVLKKFAIQGIGNGSFKVFMPMSGAVETNSKDANGNNIGMIPIWAHNDVLQFFIENGIIGCLLIVGLIFSLDLGIPGYVFLAALLPNIIFNFPTHLAPDVLLIVLNLKNLFVER